MPIGAEPRVARIGFELAQFVEAAEPRIPDFACDQLGLPRIAHSKPSPRRYAVRDVDEFFRPNLVKIAQNIGLQQLRVQLGDTVDRMAADAREIRHTDRFLALLADQ